MDGTNDNFCNTYDRRTWSTMNTVLYFLLFSGFYFCLFKLNVKLLFVEISNLICHDFGNFSVFVTNLCFTVTYMIVV